MGAEQGTVVSRSIVELPYIADLTDPRLPRAFNSWIQFSQNHSQQIEEIGLLHPAEVVSLAGDLSNAISRSIGVERSSSSAISEEKLVQLTDIVSGDGNRVIFMRHGEQSPPEWVSSLTSPALRKIRMMRDPYNRQDLLTNNSLVDVFVTALALLRVQSSTGRRTRIFSSENFRAKEAAYIISVVMSGSTVSTLEGLNCITYKDEADQPPVTEDDLLSDLPSGMMPWSAQLVDKLCKRPKSGMSQSQAIIDTVSSLVKYADRKNGNKLAIVLTHNQQIAEVLREVDQLNDPSVRFPELTMLAVKNGSCVVLERGVLRTKAESQPKASRNMRRVLEVFGDGYEWYKIRRVEYERNQKIPFLVSPNPLNLSWRENQELMRIGGDTVDFMQAADELYKSEEDVKTLLDYGKPPIFQGDRKARYLFIRPDLIITQGGFTVCEIETSPFGLALAELLNRSYRFAGFETLVSDEALRNFVVTHTPPQGRIVYSQKTSSYAGQLAFLADQVFAGNNRAWKAEQADYIEDVASQAIYRGFYLHEYTTDMFVSNVVESSLQDLATPVMPSFTPYMEEKALLALIWDRRWECFLSRQLGNATFRHLREVIPPSWIIGQEQFFTLGLPEGISSSVSVASLPKSKRQFVLKQSGFGAGSSWAEGINFLQEKSSAKAEELLSAAQHDSTSLYVVQEFREGQKRKILYEEGGLLQEMNARVRITPYFSMLGNDRGRLIAIKATGCEKTNYIHASTGSINTAVAGV